MNLRFDEEPNYGQYIAMFEPLAGTERTRPLLVEGLLHIGIKRQREEVSNEENESNSRKKIRLGIPAAQWISIYNAHKPMKQRHFISNLK